MVCAFVALEDIDRLSDEAPETGYGALARFPEHRPQARERLFEGVKSGLQGGRNRSVAAAAFNFSRIAARLWLDRLSMTTMSPDLSSGTRTEGTWASNQSPLIGPSSTIGAMIPDSRWPATNVVVLLRSLSSWVIVVQGVVILRTQRFRDMITR